MDENERGERKFGDGAWDYPLAVFVAGMATLLLMVTIKVGGLVYALVGGVDPETDNAVEALRGVGWLFGALVGGFVAAGFGIWRGLIAEKQTAVSRDQYERSLDRDYADLFTKAVEQLGTDKVIKRAAKDAQGEQIFDENGRAVMEEMTEPNIEVRLGAIYALERISQDSERDHIAVMETLCAYVRENAPAAGCERRPYEENRVKNGYVKLYNDQRNDVQAIFNSIGRRAEKNITYENTKKSFKLNFTDCNLRGYDFSYGNFSNIDFSYSYIEESIFRNSYIANSIFTLTEASTAIFNDCNAQGVNFAASNLRGATLTNCLLQNAYLTEANMSDCYLANSDFSQSTIFNTLLYRSNIVNTKWRNVNGLKFDIVNLCFGCMKTVLSENIHDCRPKHWYYKGLERPRKQFDAYETWKAARAAGERPPWVSAEDWTGW